jgi:hypothetical protein
MARNKLVDVDPDNVDDDGLCAAQSRGSAGNLTLNGALVSGGVFTENGIFGRQLVITSVGNDSGITFTVTGTCPDGVAQSEVITGPNATLTESSKYFRTVTQIATSGATANNVTVGTVDEVATNTIPLNSRSSDPATIAVDVTGTINYTVQETFHEVLTLSSPNQNATWYNVLDFTTATTDIVASLTRGATGVRLLVNSYTNTAELQMRIIEGYL